MLFEEESFEIENPQSKLSFHVVVPSSHVHGLVLIIVSGSSWASVRVCYISRLDIPRSCLSLSISKKFESVWVGLWQFDVALMYSGTLVVQLSSPS